MQRCFFYRAGGALLLVGVGIGLGFGCSSESSGTGGAAATGTGTLSGGGNCTGASDCSAGQICDPATNQCVDPPPCTSNRECGAEAVCEDGHCVPNGSGGPCQSDADCPAGQSCTGGFCGCGGDVYGAEAIPPNVLIALDRSLSMSVDPPINGETKWDIAVTAIGSILGSAGGSARWGLKLWPGDQSCGSNPDCSPGMVFVDVGDNTAAQINGTLGGIGEWCPGTPITDAVASVADYPGLEDTTRANYLLLITDGKQQFCEGDEVGAVTMLRNEMPEIKTFVVGFGDGVDPATLDAMAMAGGTAKAASPYYYQADDAASLTAALASIAGKVLSCTYQLSAAPPDPNQLSVYFDNVAVPRDPTHTEGWDYDPATQTITFYGSACLSLQQGLVTDLVVSYGCPSTVTGTGGGPPCTPDGGACTSAADCCGGSDCIDGMCGLPVPK